MERAAIITSERERRVPAISPPLPDSSINTFFGGTDSDTIFRKASCPCGGGCPACQAKSNLNISQPNDPAEIEADAIADKVMRMPVGEVNANGRSPHGSKGVTNSAYSMSGANTIQRKCDVCEEDEEKIQRKALPSNSGISAQNPGHVNSVISSGGQPLDKQTRSFFEPRLGYDLSGVRIYTDSAANQSARAIDARAYTLGSNIVFGSGEYRPDSESGKHLIAHELAHVAQQGNGKNVLHRKPKGAKKDSARAAEIKLSRTSLGDVMAGYSENMMYISFENFAINESKLKKEHREVIAGLSKLSGLGILNFKNIQVIGHADSTGGDDHNVSLSDSRAWAVAEQLTGFAPNVMVTGRGEAEPVIGNESVSERSENRRVEITLELNKPAPSKKEDPPPPPKKKNTDIYDPPEDWTGLCKYNPDWCSIILACAVAPILCETGLLCARYPLLCLSPLYCLLFPKRCKGDKEKEKEKEKPKEKPCPIRFYTMDGKGKVNPKNLKSELHDLGFGVMKLGSFFTMYLEFSNDREKGCNCELGEYKQMVEGYFEATPKGGQTDRTEVPYSEDTVDSGYVNNSGSIIVDESITDAIEAPTYGDRSSKQESHNKYYDADTPEDQRMSKAIRKTGCIFEGNDSPGMRTSLPGVRLKFMLKFRGGPVGPDRKEPEKGSRLDSYWKDWIAEGEATTPEKPSTGPEPESEAV